MAEELTAEMESIKDEIKAEMTAREADEIVTGEYKVRWTKVTSSRFDSTGFKKAMPELYDKFTKQIESRRFAVV